ncbi:MAG: AAA family ATPase [Candidatus Eisenbacteria bacterium]
MTYPGESKSSKHGPRGNVVRAHVHPWRGVNYYHTKYENGTWLWSRWVDGLQIFKIPDDVELPLWRHEKLAAAEAGTPVLLCEGERDVETAEALGYLACSVPSGAVLAAKKWIPLYTKSLARFDCVVILEDNDSPGRKHGPNCARPLRPLIRDLRVVRFPELPEHGDLTDWIAAGHTRDDLDARIMEAPQWKEEGGARAVVTRMCDVEKRRVEWLWPGRIPRAMLTLLEGDPGCGKSTLTLDLAARVSRGAAMPDDSGGGEARTVAILSAEDDPGAVIRPRLEAAGADLSRVVILSMQTDTETREPVISDADVAAWETVMLEERAALLVVDPLVAYLPDATDTNSDHSVRRALVRLKGLAEHTGSSVVAVRHWKKAPTDKALHRGGGSVAFIAAARAGLVVGNDPNDESERTRVLAVSKMNLAPIAPSLSFRLEVESPHDVPHVEWVGVSGHTANALTSAPVPGEDRSALDRAKGFLKNLLADGPVRSVDVDASAKEARISKATLRRAGDVLGVVSSRVGSLGSDGHWTWSLRRSTAANGEEPEGDRHLTQDSAMKGITPAPDAPEAQGCLYVNHERLSDDGGLSDEGVQP